MYRFKLLSGVAVVKGAVLTGPCEFMSPVRFDLNCPVRVKLVEETKAPPVSNEVIIPSEEESQESALEDVSTTFNYSVAKTGLRVYKDSANLFWVQEEEEERKDVFLNKKGLKRSKVLAFVLTQQG